MRPSDLQRPGRHRLRDLHSRCPLPNHRRGQVRRQSLGMRHYCMLLSWSRTPLACRPSADRTGRLAEAPESHVCNLASPARPGRPSKVIPRQFNACYRGCLSPISLGFLNPRHPNQSMFTSVGSVSRSGEGHLAPMYPTYKTKAGGTHIMSPIKSEAVLIRFTPSDQLHGIELLA